LLLTVRHMRIILLLLSGALAFAQTTINGDRTILGVWDATGATHTKPAKTGLLASIPATCGVGEEYFASDATAGSNKYLCTSTNVWTQQSGGGGGGVTALTEWQPTVGTTTTTNDTVSWGSTCTGSGAGVVGETCMLGNPHGARVTNGPFTARYTTASGNHTGTVYLCHLADNSQKLVVGGASLVTGDFTLTNITAVSGTSCASAAADASPMWKIDVNSVSSASQFAGTYTFYMATAGHSFSVQGGTGITCTAGSPDTCALDTTVAALLNASTNAQTGTTYTLAASDNGKVVTFNNASNITLTVPAGLGAGFNCLIVQLGAGTVTPTASSTTIHQRQSLTKTAGQYAAASLVAYAADVFVLSGDLQ